MQKSAFFAKDKNFYRQLARLTFFIALQNVIVCMVGLVDNIMVGQYAESSLSGVALANQIQFLLQMAVGGICEGMMVLASQYWGAKNPAAIRKTVAIAVRLAGFMGLIFWAACSIFPASILSLLTKDAAAISEGAAYMRIVSFSYAFFCVGNVLLSAQRSVENVSVGMFSSSSGVVVNVVLNYVLIFGRFGFPELGVQGAAIATVIGRLVEFGVAAGYTFCVEKKLALKLRDLVSFDRILRGDYARVATPVIMASASWGVAMTVQTAILGHMGGSAIAASSIANSLFQVITVIAYGSASASGIITGKAVGADNLDNLRAYVRTMQIIYLGIGLLTSGCLLATKDLLLASYEVSEQTYHLANQFMIVLSITVIGTSYQCPCLTGIVRGGGDTKFVFYNDLIFMWGIVLPSSLLSAFVLHLSPAFVFFCLKSDQLLKCAVAVWEVNSYRWVRKVTRLDAAPSASVDVNTV